MMVSVRIIIQELSRDGNDNYNYKNIGGLGSFPSVEAGQAENTIIGSDTTITNNNNTKEITLVAEDAEIEIAPGKRVNQCYIEL